MTAMQRAHEHEFAPESAFWPAQRKMTLADRIYARLPSGYAAAGSIRIVAEPRTIGSADRGRAILGGKLSFGSDECAIPSGGIWETDAGNRGLLLWTHGFAWLDDLAAVKDGPAISMSKESVLGWIRRYGGGKGPGWAADIAARRLIRWVGHSRLLMAGWTERELDIFAGAILRNAGFVERRWQSLPRGFSRFEALAGMIYANSMFIEREPSLRKASELISREANRMIGPQGEIPSRNPEELLRIATLLSWAIAVLIDAMISPPADLINAIKRAALVLRAIRHANGPLARFQGGGSAPIGYLDRIIADSGERYVPLGELSMGYAKLSARGTSVIVDAAPPNSGNGTETSHASTLAFEFFANGIPIVVNRSGTANQMRSMDQELRETRSSSTVEVDGCSSSRFAPLGMMSGDHCTPLLMAPKNVRIGQLPGRDGQTLIASHDGYRPQYGLTHMRRMDLADDGSRLWGEDTIWARSKDDREAYSKALAAANAEEIGFATRFHVHPETKVTRSGNSARLRTADGNQWDFRFEGAEELKIVSSECMGEARDKGRASSQIVLESSIGSASGQLRWKFERVRSSRSSLTVRSANEKPQAAA